MDEETKRELQDRLNALLSAEPDKDYISKYAQTNDFLSQVLSNFIVIGYDLENNPFVLGNNRTPKDADALRTLVQKVMMGGADLNIKKL